MNHKKALKCVLLSFLMLVLDSQMSVSNDNEQKFSQLAVQKGTLIFDWNDIGAFWFRNEGRHGKKLNVPVKAMPFTEALEIKTLSKPPHDHYLRLSLDTPIKLKQNDIVLLSFYARTTQSNTEGHGRMGVNLQRSSKPWTVHNHWPLTIEREWKRYYAPFTIQVKRGFGMEIIPPTPSGGDAKTFAIGEVRFGLKFGYAPQTVQIADLKAVNYGPDLPGEQLPYTPIKNSSDAVVLSKALAGHKASPSWTPKVLDDLRTGRQYLPDFSYAGYHFGEDALPILDEGSRILNVTDYGAVPNDGNDDTAAVRQALARAEAINEPVIIQFPAGQLDITDILFIKRGHLTMRGAGSGNNGTILNFGRPLAQMQKPDQILEQEEEIRQNNMKTDQGDDYSPFSWLGGVLWIEPAEGRSDEFITNACGVLHRGGHTITVDSANDLYIGQVVQLQWHDCHGGDSILPHIFNCEAYDLADGFGESLLHAPQVWQNLTIERIDDNYITFKEPINHGIRAEWRHQIHKVSFIREVGVVGFKIQFPLTVYAGHHCEEGYNAVYMNRAMHSWICDVEIVNCDSGVIINHGKNITAQTIVISGRYGHYSLMARDSDQVLFRGFEISAGSLHNPSFNTYCRSSVYTHGKISNAQLDQHNGMNHQNLWDDLEVHGSLGGLWEHGGSASDAPTHGAFNVAWNLRFMPRLNTPVRANDILDGPSAYLIGLVSSAPLMFRYGPNAYLEGLNRLNIAVPSLYEYQLKKRTRNRALAASP